jgi:hypothetical protein
MVVLQLSCDTDLAPLGPPIHEFLMLSTVLGKLKPLQVFSCIIQSVIIDVVDT